MPDIDLAALTATQGTRFVLPGTVWYGKTVAAAGDVNGDGIADVLVSSGTLSVWLVHGRAGGLGETLDLSALTAGQGTRFAPYAGSGSGTLNLGWAVSAAGDVNGDGLADLLISQPDRNPSVGTGAPAGYVHVVFGQAGGLGAVLSLDTLTPAQGFRIEGAPVVGGADFSARFGMDVAGLGDINGDGLGDIGAVTGRGVLSATLVYGAAERNAVGVPVSGLASDSGVVVSTTGTGIAGVGDVTGDGRGDVLLAGSDAAVLMFGQPGDWSPLAPGPLPADRGIRIFSSNPSVTGVVGPSVAAAGDVNGDGIADMLLTGIAPWAPGNIEFSNLNSTGTPVWVVYGRAGGFQADVDVAALTPSEGFRIVDSSTDEQIGAHIATAGDVNGDGIDDILVLATASDGSVVRSVYVVFGQLGGFAGTLDLATMTDEQGFRIAHAENLAGNYDNVVILPNAAAAGDVNADGVGDLLIRLADPQSFAGQTIVLYGQAEAFDWAGTAGTDSKAGTLLDDLLSGRGGDDLLRANGGNDTLLGGAGGDTLQGGVDDDLLDGGNDSDLLQGGAGRDTLTGGTGSDTLDGGGGADVLIGGPGFDIFVVDDAGDVILDDPGSIGAVQASVSWTLAGDLLFLDLIGTAAIGGTGTDVANRIVGNGAANRLSGLGGNDDLRGGGGNDRLWGNADQDTLAGEAGNDLLRGGGGGDLLEGGAGRDTLTGGTGADIFRFSTAPLRGETDRLTDFTQAQGDRMEISLAAFDPDGVTGLALGSLAAQAGRFEANLSGTATTLQTRFVYETDRGFLLFDADGLGGAAAIRIAKLDGAPALLAGDVWIVA